MARREGTLKLTSNFEPRVAAPLDARSKVATLAELTASGTFPYPYTGMEVYVTSEQKKYLLIGNDTTVAANWVEAGSGSGQAGKINATALETVSDIEEAEDGFYLCLTDSKVYQADSGTAAEVEKEIDTCLITNELYEDNKATLDSMDIVFIITDVSDSATTDEIIERIVALEEDTTVSGLASRVEALEEDTTVSGLASRVEALEEGSLGEGLEALGYLPLASLVNNATNNLTFEVIPTGMVEHNPSQAAANEVLRQSQSYTSYIQFVVNGQKLLLSWGIARLASHSGPYGNIVFPTSYSKIPMVNVSPVQISAFNDAEAYIGGNGGDKSLHNCLRSISKTGFQYQSHSSAITEEIACISWMAIGLVD